MIDMHSLNWATVTAGGLGVGIASSIWAYCRGLIMNGVYWIKGRVVTTLLIDTQSTNMLSLFNRWFMDHPYGKSCRRLMMKEIPGVGSRMIPSAGTHPIKWNGKRLLVNISMKDPTPGEYGGPKQSVSIQAFAGRTFLEEFVTSLREIDEKRVGTRVYANSGDHWGEIGLINPRPIESLVFPPDFVAGIKRDVESFYASAEQYKARGLPWRRGYLFAGEPGTGKSSLIEALAGALDMNVHLLSLKSASDGSLSELLNDVEGKSLVVIEDIDCSTESRVTKAPNPADVEGMVEKSLVSRSGPSLATLLNSLDGIGAPQGRVIFVTTNFMDRLDPALTRPGRLDVKITFPLLTDQTARQLYGLLGDLSPLTLDEFLIQAIGESPAAGRGLLLQSDLLLKLQSPAPTMMSDQDQTIAA